MKTIFWRDMQAVLTKTNSFPEEFADGMLRMISAALDRGIIEKVTREYRIYLPEKFYASDALTLGGIIKKEALIESCSLGTGLRIEVVVKGYNRLNAFLKKQLASLDTEGQIHIEGFGTFSKSVDGVFYEAKTLQSLRDHPYLKGK